MISSGGTSMKLALMMKLMMKRKAIPQVIPITITSAGVTSRSAIGRSWATGFFAATAMAGRLYVHDILGHGPWDPSQLESQA